MTASDESPSPLAEPVRRPPSGELPPVEPPTMGFILQLFVIPMVIVTVIVLIWLLFNWLAHMGSNPVELVSDLKRLNDSSWQKALTLADLLRNPQYHHLKQDPALAQELASVLDGQLNQAAFDENSVRLRMFLCRALGEFETPEGLPVLLKAAETERDRAEGEVRLSALQAIAVFVSNNRDLEESTRQRILTTLLEASRTPTEGSDAGHLRGELRSHAAFALGALGGDDAIARLVQLLDDGYSNARYNAATGLSRHGDARALPVLLEMLNPDNPEAVSSEDNDQVKPLKRLAVLRNSLRAASQLLEKNQDFDKSELIAALERLKDSELEQLDAGSRRGLRVAAEEVLIEAKTGGG